MFRIMETKTAISGRDVNAPFEQPYNSGYTSHTLKSGPLQ